MTLVEGGLRRVEEQFPAGRFAHVLCNPPLLHAVKGGRADLTVLPPLVVHADDEHAFTDEVRAMIV